MVSGIFRRAVRLLGKNPSLHTRLNQNTQGEISSSFIQKPAFYAVVLLGTAGLSFGYYSINYPPTQLPHDPDKKSLVILGTGWGGVTLIENLKSEDYNVTVVSPRDYFVYTPLLPSYSVGTVSLASLVVGIRDILAYKKREVRFVKALCTDVDVGTHTITIQATDHDDNVIDGSSIKYDYLVISTGTNPSSLDVPGLAENGIPVRDPAHSRAIKDRIDHCLELASIKALPSEEVHRLLSVVIVGAGPTGVEMASIIKGYLDSEVSKVTIVEGSDRILPALSPDAAHSADAYLKDTGVYVFTGAMADGVTQKLVKIIKADGSTEKISCGTIISAIGESPTELVPKLIEKLGDVHQGISYPNTAQVASQQAKYIASMLQKLAVLDQEKKNIANSGLDEKEVQKALLPPFRFRNKGIVVSMGYPHAVVQFPNKYVMSNYLSYLLWKLVILYNMKGISSKVSYVTDTIRSMIFRSSLP